MHVYDAPPVTDERTSCVARLARWLQLLRRDRTTDCVPLAVVVDAQKEPC